jgi:hypothetical protein
VLAPSAVTTFWRNALRIALSSKTSEPCLRLTEKQKSLKIRPIASRIIMLPMNVWAIARVVILRNFRSFSKLTVEKKLCCLSSQS